MTGDPIPDLQDLLAERTGLRDGWSYIDGPASRCGIDYWLRHASGLEVYVNVDQDEVTMEILNSTNIVA